jgi:hypothetical protein
VEENVSRQSYSYALKESETGKMKTRPMWNELMLKRRKVIEARIVARWHGVDNHFLKHSISSHW